MSRSLRLLLLSGLLMLAPCLLAAPTLIRYPRVSGPNDPLQQYILALLHLACDKSGQACQLQAARYMVQSRAIVELQKPDSSIDLLWTMTSIQRERQLRPVRIPLYKGLMGWRVALLGRGREQLLARVKDLASLRALRAGQGHDWPDVDILRAAGLQVLTSSDYDPLFSMLNQGRFDYFPRGIIEVENEFQAHRHSGISIDPYVLLYYPTAFYFFVARDNQALATLLQTGLERAIADGSFERLFQQYHGATLQRLRVAQRTIIRLPNPQLPAQTPLTRKILWQSLP